MVENEGGGGLLRDELPAFGQGESDPLGGEEAEELLVLGKVRAGRVAPGRAAPLTFRKAQLAADQAVDVLGHRLGALRREAVEVVALGVAALAVELVAELVGAIADGHDLER